MIEAVEEQRESARTSLVVCCCVGVRGGCAEAMRSSLVLSVSSSRTDGRGPTLPMDLSEWMGGARGAMGVHEPATNAAGWISEKRRRGAVRERSAGDAPLTRL